MQSILRALSKYFGNHVWGSFLSHIVNISIREQSIKKYTCNAQLRGLKLVNGLGFARLEFKVQDLNTISRVYFWFQIQIFRWQMGNNISILLICKYFPVLLY